MNEENKLVKCKGEPKKIDIRGDEIVLRYDKGQCKIDKSKVREVD